MIKEDIKELKEITSIANSLNELYEKRDLINQKITTERQKMIDLFERNNREKIKTDKYIIAYKQIAITRLNIQKLKTEQPQLYNQYQEEKQQKQLYLFKVQKPEKT